MLKKIWSNKPLIGLIIFAVIVSVLNPRFLTHANILNVLRQTSINSIIAIGMTLVILTGGIDLSVGSILAFCLYRLIDFTLRFIFSAISVCVFI